MTTDDLPDRSDGDAETSDAAVSLPASGYGIYECANCDNVVLTMGEAGAEMVCHGDEMREVTDCEMDVEPPELRQVLYDVFDLPKSGIDICLFVISQGPQSASQIAARLDYDRSTVSRYLNELVELGLLEKRQLNREEGGVVNVYRSTDLGEMRRETLVGFYVWAGEAARLIERANVAKEEFSAETAPEDLEEVFWEGFDSGS